MDKVLYNKANDKSYKIAIVGATGLVGQTALKVLSERKLPISEYGLFASSKSDGRIITVNNKDYTVEELTEDSFSKTKYDFALFSAGSDIAKKFAPIAVKNGTIVVDNSSAFRLVEDVPLVVPEVNPEDMFMHNGIIANPNCSTIQAMVALKPLDKIYKIKRIIFSTYQAVSGAGYKGIQDYENNIKGIPPKKFVYPIYNNCLPHIDTFTDNGYTKEEMKMVNETRKILHRDDLKITATAVRVPVLNSHCESINVEFENNFDLNELKDILRNSESIILEDDISNNIYPIPTHVNNHDSVFVGRIRRDFSIENGVNMWVVADNIRKGAATNAIQIIEKLILQN